MLEDRSAARSGKNGHCDDTETQQLVAVHQLQHFFDGNRIKSPKMVSVPKDSGSYCGLSLDLFPPWPWTKCSMVAHSKNLLHILVSCQRTIVLVLRRGQCCRSASQWQCQAIWRVGSLQDVVWHTPQGTTAHHQVASSPNMRVEWSSPQMGGVEIPGEGAKGPLCGPVQGLRSKLRRYLAAQRDVQLRALPPYWSWRANYSGHGGCLESDGAQTSGSAPSRSSHRWSRPRVGPLFWSKRSRMFPVLWLWQRVVCWDGLFHCILVQS